jgi:hypothetical protein
MNTTKIRIDFKSKTQEPYLMIIKEYYWNDVIQYAEVIYKEDKKESDVVIDSNCISVIETRLERKHDL